MDNVSPVQGLTYVMVDYENVQPSVIRFAMQPETHFIVFVGHQQDRVNFGLASVLQPLGERAQYVKIHGIGANALDFHIALFIGKISACDPNASFVVISNDKGYDPIIQYLNANGTKIERHAMPAELKPTSQPKHQVPTKSRHCKREGHIKRITRALVAMYPNVPKDKKGLEGVIRSTGGHEPLSNKEMKGIVFQLNHRGLVNTHGKQVVYNVINTKLKKSA